MAITERDIARINELYHKSKAEGLTPAEAAEQKKLREDYIAAIRGAVRNQMENVRIVEPDGTITKPKRRPKH